MSAPGPHPRAHLERAGNIAGALAARNPTTIQRSFHRGRALFGGCAMRAEVEPHDRTLPILLTADEAADLLRTSRRAIYAMIEPTEAERDCCEEDDSSRSPHSRIRRQDAGHDHDRRRAAAEISARRPIPEDGQQRADDVERGAEDGSRVESDRAGSVLDRAAADAEERGELLRLRRIRTARRSGITRAADATR